MSEWEYYKLGELTEIGSSKRIFSAEYKNKGVPFWRGKEITELGSGKSVSTELFISEKKYYEIKNKHGVPSEGDILVTSVGTIGNVYQVKASDKFYFKDGNVTWIKNFDSKISSLFLYKWFNSNLAKREINAVLIGSTQQALTISALKELTIQLPDISDQVEIANIIDILDKKITLLRKQNRTIEELAQTLFKHWFVEFEFPNENGQPYKSSGGKMVESELGEIPEGWRIGEVSDFVKHSTKSVSPGKEPNKIFSHYSIPAFDSGRYPTKDIGESILSNKYVVLENSILVSKLNPSTSRIWTVFKPCENGICSTEIQVFVPNTHAYAFSFGLFHYSGIKREMAQRASGTSSSHQRVRPGDILNIEFVVPREDTLKKFEESVLGTLKKIEENQEEIQSLTQLRDTLLPKLMSGELRITEN